MDKILESKDSKNIGDDGVELIEKGLKAKSENEIYNKKIIDELTKTILKIAMEAKK